jgi:hypothetical protein
MKPKLKTITVVEGFPMRDDTTKCNGYKITKVTDSIEYNPGDLIHKTIVEKLCDAADWKVTVLPYESQL